MSLCIQGQGNYAQLVRRNPRSGKTFPAANLEDSIAVEGSGKPKLVHSSREIQRDHAGGVDIRADHTSKKGVQVSGIPIWKASLLMTLSRTPIET